MMPLEGKCCKVLERSLISDGKWKVSPLTKSFGHGRLFSVRVMEGCKDNGEPEGMSAEPTVPIS